MKPGWQVRPLGEVALIGAGNPAPQDRADFEGGALPFIRTSDVGQIRFGEIETAADLINERCASRLRLVPRGTVLMPKSGASTFLNHRVIMIRDAYVSSHLATITPRPETLDPRFLLYALHQVRAQDLLPENSYPSLNLSLVASATIPVPPLEEQRRIGAVLDDAFDGLSRARANTAANLADARHLASSVIDGLFRRMSAQIPKVELQAICDPRGITYGVIKLGDHDPSGVPCLRTSNVRPLGYELEGMKKISKELSGEYSRTVLKGGEVLVNVRGTLGGVCAVPMEMVGWNISREVAMVAVDHRYANPKYIALFISTQAAQDWLTGVVKGAAYKGINLTDLRLLSVPLPSILEQEDIVAAASEATLEITQVHSAKSAQLSELDTLRQSLLEKAFAGELT